MLKREELKKLVAPYGIDSNELEFLQCSQNYVYKARLAFLKGYAVASPLKEINLTQLKDFFLLREAVIYVHYHRTLEVSKMSESFLRGLEVMKRNVEKQDHQVDFALISENQKHIKAMLTTEQAV